MSQDGLVRTVLGRISMEGVGITSIHEHLYARAAPELIRHDPDLDLTQLTPTLSDLADFFQLGGRTIVDMTTMDYGRDISALVSLEETSKVHVVAATGMNKAKYCEAYVNQRGINILADQWIKELTEGVGETHARPGVLKAATSLDKIHSCEEKVLRSVARAHKETGWPISTHTEAGTMAEEQVDLLISEGVPPDHIIIGHMDRRPDPALHRRLIGRGVFLGYDQIPKKKYGTRDPALGLLIQFAREGLHHSIVLGGDLSRRSYYRGWGGKPGLKYLIGTFRTDLYHALEAAHLDADQIVTDLFTINPGLALQRRPTLS